MSAHRHVLGQRRRRISPAGVDVDTGEQVMSPMAASLAVRQSSRKSPLVLTQEEIDVFEEQARAELRRLGMTAR